MGHHFRHLTVGSAAWSSADWEDAWSPYDDGTYDAALRFIRPDDVVLDIGAGDLRFALRAAACARAVIAIERRADLLRRQTPPNVDILCGDALSLSFTRGVTVAVLLMRHCAHFADYVAKLQAAGIRQLVTNARWGMDVECVSLTPLHAFDDAPPGWYACLCGAVGFKPCWPEQVTATLLALVSQVKDCPACTGRV